MIHSYLRYTFFVVLSWDHIPMDKLRGNYLHRQPSEQLSHIRAVNSPSVSWHCLIFSPQPRHFHRLSYTPSEQLHHRNHTSHTLLPYLIDLPTYSCWASTHIIFRSCTWCMTSCRAGFSSAWDHLCSLCEEEAWMAMRSLYRCLVLLCSEIISFRCVWPLPRDRNLTPLLQRMVALKHPSSLLVC